jgi:hypothetical protein
MLSSIVEKLYSFRLSTSRLLNHIVIDDFDNGRSLVEAKPWKYCGKEPFEAVFFNPLGEALRERMLLILITFNKIMAHSCRLHT